VSTVSKFPGRAKAPRRPRVNEEKADCAVSCLELSESALRQALAEHLPFSGLKLTQEEVAELRHIADRIGFITATVEARVFDEERA